MRKDGVTTRKPEHQTIKNARVMWSDESSYTLFPISGRIYVCKTPKEAYNPECLVRFQQRNTGEVFFYGLGSNTVVF
jgi:hypothetical protein